MEQLLPFWSFWRLNELKWGKCSDWHVESGKHSIVLAITIISLTALTALFMAARAHSRRAPVRVLWGASSLLFHPHNTKDSLLLRRYCALKCIWRAVGERARLTFIFTSFSNSLPETLRSNTFPFSWSVSIMWGWPHPWALGLPGLSGWNSVTSLAWCLVQRRAHAQAALMTSRPKDFAGTIGKEGFFFLLELL